jgi:hypothetical protein
MTRHQWFVVGAVVAGILFYLVVVTVGVHLAKRAGRMLDHWESKRAAEAFEARIRAQRDETERMRQAAVNAHKYN